MNEIVKRERESGNSFETNILENEKIVMSFISKLNHFDSLEERERERESGNSFETNILENEKIVMSFISKLNHFDSLEERERERKRERDKIHFCHCYFGIENCNYFFSPSSSSSSSSSLSLSLSIFF
ncbi:hypothetical protein SSS_10205 [Sarcoptes scabiei]|nr:hypothetical protein SSS_10205 [Sarcoptes scabiei]